MVFVWIYKLLLYTHNIDLYINSSTSEFVFTKTTLFDLLNIRMKDVFIISILL